ncbi:MAG: DUF4870 domain-containing protein [Candidatus Acidiferrales bacterium]
MSDMSSFPAPSEDEKTMAFLAQLLMALTGFIGPLVIYLVRRKSPFVAFHALQALFWEILRFLLTIAAMAVFMFLFILKIGQAAGSGHPPQSLPPHFFLFFPLLWLVFMGVWAISLALGIYFGIQAKQGKWAQYPVLGKLALKCVSN